MTVIICGAGIGGLCLGLSLQQLNIPFQIFESSVSIEPLGVGVNLQPNAVRELFALGLKDDLTRIGIQTEEFGLFSKIATYFNSFRGNSTTNKARGALRNTI